MKKRLLYTIVLFIFILLLIPSVSLAHPGGTAADGCHYCRTNCDRWGVAWNERHCHNSRASTGSTSSQSNQDKSNSNYGVTAIVALAAGGAGYWAVKKFKK